MAKSKSKTATTATKKKKRDFLPAERLDRRFMPAATASSGLLYAAGAIGALLLGAGGWGHFGHLYIETPPFPHAFWLLAAGALLVGGALWFSTSGDAAIRAGAPGIAEERNGVRRIPWFALEQISWASGDEALVISGKDESEVAATFQIRARAHAQAIAWILHEATERLPQKVDVSAAVRARFGAPDETAGVKVLEPLQLVGKRCAKSGKTIAYEPDARMCPRCDRVYHKRSTPEACACGEDLTALRDAMETFDED
jgi:hypothetical protein